MRFDGDLNDRGSEIVVAVVGCAARRFGGFVGGFGRPRRRIRLQPISDAGQPSDVDVTGAGRGCLWVGWRMGYFHAERPVCRRWLVWARRAGI